MASKNYTMSVNMLHGVKTHNNLRTHGQKVELRRRILETMGPDKCHVFDAYAGSGTLYRSVWHQAASYTGCDTEWYRDERRLYACDNRLVMRAVDLKQWNVFDFDPYGSPWDLIYILIKRRGMQPGERLGIAVTEGSGLKLKFGDCPRTLAELARINPKAIRGLKQQTMIINNALERTCHLMHARMVERWEAASPTVGSGMRYFAVILEGQPALEGQKHELLDLALALRSEYLKRTKPGLGPSDEATLVDSLAAGLGIQVDDLQTLTVGSVSQPPVWDFVTSFKVSHGVELQTVRTRVAVPEGKDVTGYSHEARPSARWRNRKLLLCLPMGVNEPGPELDNRPIMGWVKLMNRNLAA